MKYRINRRSWLSLGTSLLASAVLLAATATSSEAKPKGSALNVIPTVTRISLENGQLVASGTATATIKGKTYSSPFTAPVLLALAPDQPASTACPVLDLALGPINLDLLGLVVETSPICVQITAYEGGGLLGDLLCNVANLLQGGLSLEDVLAGLPLNDITGTPVLSGINPNDLLTGLTTLLNQALGNLLGGALSGIDPGAAQSCGILHLELGPLDLNLLGLEVILDDCASGPVVVDITAVRGKGNLLGNLLCSLVSGNQLSLGSTLQQILNQLLGRLG